MRALKAIGIFLTVSIATVLVFELVVSEPVVMEIGRRPTDVTGAVRGAIALAASSLATWLYVRRNPNRSLHSMFSAGAAGLTPYVLGRMFSAGAAGLTPTHSIPEQGLPIRRKPDPNEKPFRRLPGGQEVHVETHEGDWARLVGSEGKSLKREEMLPVNGRPRGWVDSRRLTDVPDRQ